MKCRWPAFARHIADALLEQPAVLALSTRRLVLDVRQRFRCGSKLAQTAVAIARKSAA